MPAVVLVGGVRSHHGLQRIQEPDDAEVNCRGRVGLPLLDLAAYTVGDRGVSVLPPLRAALGDVELLGDPPGRQAQVLADHAQLRWLHMLIPRAEVTDA